jgi:hypothetical protein
VRAREFDETRFFRAIVACGARALLIGRRALVVLGLPVLTADYDFWLHPEDIERFNGAVAPFDLVPTHPPDDARRRGRYAVENDEHIDLLVARAVTTIDGLVVKLEDVWARRQTIQITDGCGLPIPTIDDLIATKRFVARPKDLEDIRMLEVLRGEDQP